MAGYNAAYEKRLSDVAYARINLANEYEKRFGGKISDLQGKDRDNYLKLFKKVTKLAKQDADYLKTWETIKKTVAAQ